MKNSPFLSIVLPTRDRPKLVEQCLACIKAQSFQNYEVIISDNAVNESCRDIVAAFLTDPRFRYFQPPQPLAMSEHWEFAITFATGSYVAVISEKFMFRPDAFSVLNKLAAEKQPDILSWQYDYFELTDNHYVLGQYHPLLKPVAPEYYFAIDELKRRLDFIEPLFSRYKQEKNSYGKIYSGCVKRQVVDKVKNIFGRVFVPMSPDFTSMFCFLSQSELCLDVGQSLMLLASGENISNGVNTRKSIGTIVSLLDEHKSSFEQYCSRMVIPGFGVGHSVSIATDYQTILNMYSGGVLTNLKLNKASVFGWARLELEHVEDWAGYKKNDFLAALELFKSNLSTDELSVVDFVYEINTLHQRPSIREIYHSGLEKVDYFFDGINAEKLAELHWQQNLALPRRHVGLRDFTISEAVEYLHCYNRVSLQLLGLA